jgi:hypothetical protein
LSEEMSMCRDVSTNQALRFISMPLTGKFHHL